MRPTSRQSESTSPARGIPIAGLIVLAVGVMLGAARGPLAVIEHVWEAVDEGNCTHDGATETDRGGIAESVLDWLNEEDSLLINP